MFLSLLCYVRYSPKPSSNCIVSSIHFITKHRNSRAWIIGWGCNQVEPDVLAFVSHFLDHITHYLALMQSLHSLIHSFECLHQTPLSESAWFSSNLCYLNLIPVGTTRHFFLSYTHDELSLKLLGSYFFFWAPGNLSFPLARVPDKVGKISKNPFIPKERFYLFPGWGHVFLLFPFPRLMFLQFQDMVT